MRRRALALPLVFLAVGCDRHGAAATQDAATSAALEAGALLDARESAAPAAARCVATEKASLSDKPGESFDFDEAVPIAGGALVGVSREGQGGRVALVARVAPHTPPRLVELGAISGDDPPPRPFVRGAEVFAAGYVIEEAEGGARSTKARGGRGRRLTVFRVTDSAEALVTVPQASDESPAFDVAARAPGGAGSPVGAIVVWDEDAPSPDAGPIPPRGLIRVALLGPDLRAVVQVATVSPEITDAERPRVALRDGGYWVAWIARKREPTGDAAPELLEAPGEDRAYRWVELLALDEHGAPAGAVRRLSSATGHVAGFSIAGGVSRLDAAIVLDDEQGEGAGGELLQVVATAEGAPRSVTVRASGVGRSPPRLAWAEGAPGWLAYVDAADHTRLVAIDAEGAAAASDAIEPALDDARLVAAIASAGSGASALAVTPGPKGALTWLSCQGAP